MLKRLFILVLFGQLSLFGQEYASGVGTSAANWLGLETGTRSISMGTASVASGNSLSAVPYNPAAISFINSSETYFSRTNYLVGTSYNVLGYATRLDEFNHLGVHIFYFDSGDEEETNLHNPDGGIGDFNHMFFSIRTVFARALSDQIKLGASINYLREQVNANVGIARMQSIAFDIGANYDTQMYGILLGLSLNNIGPEVEFGGEGTEKDDEDNIDGTASAETQPFPIPFTCRFGFAVDFLGDRSSVLIQSSYHRLTLATDFIKSNDYRIYTGIGIEYSWNNMAYARFGTRLGHDDTAGLSLGVGIKFKGIMVDYAYVDYGQLFSNTSQFGISLEF